MASSHPSLIVAVVIQVLLLDSLVHCQELPESKAVPQIGNWTMIPAPEGRSLEAITVSTTYLWAIDNGTLANFADNNLAFCQRPCSDASDWAVPNPSGQFDRMIDANEDEVWGVNDRGQIYK